MLPNIPREVFEVMDDQALMSACFKPLMDRYKEVSSADGDLDDFYRNLTSNQQILFIFNTYYCHVIESVQELYWWSAFFLAQETRWNVLNEKMIELGDLEFVSLLQDVEVTLRTRNHPILLADFACVSRDDLDLDIDLRLFFQSAYVRLTQVTVRAIELLVASIRNTPEYFVK